MFTCRRRRGFDRHCGAIIDSLPIRFPFELNAFLAAVGRQHGMPITLWRMQPRRAGKTGMMVRTRNGIYVFVASQTDPHHTAHVAFHELGHLLLDHPGNSECAMPDSGSAGAASAEECQAERFAHLLLARVHAGAWRDRVRMSRRQWELRASFGARRSTCHGYA